MVTENIQPDGDVAVAWFPVPASPTTHYDKVNEDPSSPSTSTGWIAGTDAENNNVDEFSLESMRSELNIKASSITQIIIYAYGYSTSTGTGTPEGEFYNGSSWSGPTDFTTFATSWAWDTITIGSLTLSSSVDFKIRVVADSVVKYEANYISCLYVEITFTFRWSEASGVAAGDPMDEIMAVPYENIAEIGGV